ncbi:MAG: protoporphyrinogen oxidase [Caldilineaceae bacterium]|nr:protoporphyrinogen oxidase [Caldilineaceae bacterium]
MNRYDTIIIGGGIAGLSTAWHLQQALSHASYALLEAGERWGGKVKTDVVDVPEVGRFVVEGGPDSFITQKPWAMRLAETLGLSDRFLGTNQAQKQIYVIQQGKPIPMPDGVMLIVPTQFAPFALSPLISPWGKLRMGMDLFIRPRRDGEDETLADFITRRLGREALDKIAEPLMAGIYNAEAEKQSILATFPRFRTLEENHGSLIRGMLASRRARPASAPQDGARPRSIFLSLNDGMNELTDTLADDLTGDLRLNTQVTELAPRPGGYGITTYTGEMMTARSVVLAIPAYAAASLLADVAPEAAAQLNAIRYVSTGTISLAYRQADIRRPLDGYGVVIPRSEGRAINAVTVSSVKFAQRAPDGAVLLRCFFGGSRRPDMMEVDDEELVRTVRSELGELLGIDATPLFQRIYRWFNANPQYDVGHLARVAAVETALPPGLYVTGSPYRGVGLPDCVHQAEQTVAALTDGLTATRQWEQEKTAFS